MNWIKGYKRGGNLKTYWVNAVKGGEQAVLKEKEMERKKKHYRTK